MLHPLEFSVFPNLRHRVLARLKHRVDWSHGASCDSHINHIFCRRAANRSWSWTVAWCIFGSLEHSAVDSRDVKSAFCFTLDSPVFCRELMCPTALRMFVWVASAGISNDQSLECSNLITVFINNASRWASFTRSWVMIGAPVAGWNLCTLAKGPGSPRVEVPMEGGVKMPP